PHQVTQPMRRPAPNSVKTGLERTFRSWNMSNEENDVTQTGTWRTELTWERNDSQLSSQLASSRPIMLLKPMSSADHNQPTPHSEPSHPDGISLRSFKGWNEYEVAAHICMKSPALEKHYHAFIDHHITGVHIKSVGEQELREMGVLSAEDRFAILEAFVSLNTRLEDEPNVKKEHQPSGDVEQEGVDSAMASRGSKFSSSLRETQTSCPSYGPPSHRQGQRYGADQFTAQCHPTLRTAMEAPTRRPQYWPKKSRAGVSDGLTGHARDLLTPREHKGRSGLSSTIRFKENLDLLPSVTYQKPEFRQRKQPESTNAEVQSSGLDELIKSLDEAIRMQGREDEVK
ncbi:hypothetical protein LTR37_015922, partial [Vermiconidia calcicola]